MRFNLYYSVYYKKEDSRLLFSFILYKDKLNGLPWLKETLELDYDCDFIRDEENISYIGLIESLKWVNHLIAGLLLPTSDNALVIQISDKGLQQFLVSGKFKKNTNVCVREFKNIYKEVNSKIEIYMSSIEKSKNISVLYLRSNTTKRKLQKLNLEGFSILKNKQDLDMLERWEVKI